MAWPDPRRPGEPADPNRPWHWVTRSEDGGLHPLPLGWNPHLRHWVAWDGATLSVEEAARRFGYLGPCLTPAETQAQIAEAAAVPAADSPERAAEPPRGLAALAASAVPDPPPAMVYRKDAIRIHLLVFAGTLIGTVFLIDKFNVMR
ncbi:hypothetical protein [Falsiroseomonas sp. CW058]|uniref:hypothetical protein n=1 Tax=Falsiroseomonas sp. CW058 TaxID=3388664 RepID=UPI003D310FA6